LVKYTFSSKELFFIIKFSIYNIRTQENIKIGKLSKGISLRLKECEREKSDQQKDFQELLLR